MIGSTKIFLKPVCEVASEQGERVLNTEVVETFLKTGYLIWGYSDYKKC